MNDSKLCNFSYAVRLYQLSIVRHFLCPKWVEKKLAERAYI